MDYKEVNGTFYHAETSPDVIAIMERCRVNRTRIIVDLGNVETGESWNEHYETIGYVGRSMGPVKVPLLVFNRRSMGGGTILSHCIIGIKTSKGKRTLYRHPKAKG